MARWMPWSDWEASDAIGEKTCTKWAWRVVHLDGTVESHAIPEARQGDPTRMSHRDGRTFPRPTEVKAPIQIQFGIDVKMAA